MKSLRFIELAVKFYLFRNSGGGEPNVKDWLLASLFLSVTFLALSKVVTRLNDAKVLFCASCVTFPGDFYNVSGDF